MIVQNNPTPWVVFALISMVLCGVLGLMFGLNPFGPSQEVRDQAAQTQMAVAVRSTENAISAIETPQAVYVQQTAVVAQLTAIPVQQSATQIAGLAEVENSQVQATQTAIVADAENRQLADHATQTAIIGQQEMNVLSAGATATAMVQSQIKDRTTGNAKLVIMGLGAITLFVWIILHTVIQAILARTEEQKAQAQFLAEQYRMVSLRASLQNRNGHKPLYPIPNSLMQNKAKVDDKLPKVE